MVEKMIELNWIPWSDKPNCQEIIYKTCELAPSANIKKTKTKIAHWIKNGDIIVKFKDRKDYLIWRRNYIWKKYRTRICNPGHDI